MDLESIDPYSFEEGANFKLRIVRQDGFPNYDKSSFDSSSVIGNDDRIAAIESQLHSLNEVLDVKNFKSYEKLKERFLMITSGVAEPPADDDNDDDQSDPDEPTAKAKTTKTVAAKGAGKTAASKSTPKTMAADEDDADYFARLAEA